MSAPTRITVSESADAWVLAAHAGVARTRSGDQYKPSALRSYEQALRNYALPRLGHLRLTAVTRVVLQDMVDDLVSQGRAPSTVRNALLPLRAIFRRAVARTEVAVNPTLGLALPAVRGRRERIARPSEAHELIEAASTRDRAVWATALYAGLRRGELQGLRWEDIDFASGVIRVERGWDPIAGPIEPKSRSGRRSVPLIKPLRGYLAAHRLQSAGDTHVFAGPSGQPFHSRTLTNQGRAAWAATRLNPIGLHECRHTYAAFMIAAGVNAKALSTYMGHSSITITLDRYGHLLPGNENEAALMLNSYLEAASGREAWASDESSDACPIRHEIQAGAVSPSGRLS